MGKTTFIYALCEPNSRIVRYIGKADKPRRRLQGHLHKSVKANTHLGNWLRLLASNGMKPAMVVLREVPVEQWGLAEERYIRLARGLGMALVNGSDGGDGITFTPEVRSKMSASHIGVSLAPSHRAAIGAGHIGLKRTPEQCEAIGASHRGRKRTTAQCEAMSAAMTGDKNPNFGVPRTLETRAKISASNQGQKRTLEARENMRRSALAAHARRKAAKV